MHAIIRRIERILKEKKLEKVTHKPAIPIVLIGLGGILFLVVLINRIKKL